MRFLSPEWAEAVKEAANASESFKKAAASTNVKVQQVVTDAPDGDVTYWLAIADGTLDVGVGPIDDPTTTITQSYETAAQLARGELSPVAAYMSGKVQVTNLMKVMNLQGVFTELGPIVRDLPAEF